MVEADFISSADLLLRFETGRAGPLFIFDDRYAEKGRRSLRERIKP
jgi:hypothetical protein